MKTIKNIAVGSAILSFTLGILIIVLRLAIFLLDNYEISQYYFGLILLALFVIGFAEVIGDKALQYLSRRK